MTAPNPAPTPDSIRSNVMVDLNSGCWLWEGHLDTSGYGALFALGKNLRMHRVSYELFRGEIPTGMWALHKCDVRSCVNPNHIWLGTVQDNNADTKAKGRYNVKSLAGRSHCLNGHEYTPGNIGKSKLRDGTHGRRCKVCEKLSNRRRYLRRKFKNKPEISE